MKKIKTLYEIRLHCSSLEEYNKIRERLLKTNLAIFCEEKELFIQSDHLTLNEYFSVLQLLGGNRIKKISYLK